MIQLPSVFSSDALFQQKSTLTLHGTSDGASVQIQLILDGSIIEETSAAVSDGRFEAKLHTPAASMREYSLRFFDGDTYLIEHILFGELWLASGQSNMSFSNAQMPECDRYLDSLSGLPIRIYLQDYPAGRNSALFPRQPSDALGGKWGTVSSREVMRHASAVGTAFLKELTHYFRDRIPVGILNSAWGGTPMRGWLPEAEVMADPVLCEKFSRFHLLPLEEKWNSYGAANYGQPFCLYNSKIAPLLGVRVRGVIWYQGESDTAIEFTRNIYRDYLRCYHRAYAERFAADPLNFMMISSLLYPWSYGGNGETNVGRLNQAFIDAAAEEPRKFAFMPIGDLSPIWSFHTVNHPIHPANKYDVGYRLALLAETNSYDRGSQRTPATMLCYEREENRLLIRFRHASSGLHIHGPKLRGMYVAGQNGTYMPAECEIVAPDTIAVWHPYLKNPIHAAYGYSSLEEGINLFAGEFPVAPFATDSENEIRIEGKPWLNPYRSIVWVNRFKEESRDVFYHPVWQAIAESEVCTDPAFTREGLSIRICSEEQEFGAFVKSYPYNRLDLQNYTALHLHIYNTENLEAKLELRMAEGDSISLPIEQTETLGDGWAAYAVKFDALPEGEITRMTFRFRKTEGMPRFVNLESFTLIPRE